MHAWIRTFECLLHISYRLDIKWQARSDEDKCSIKQRSEEIKQKFKKRMGLIVDRPKSGYGNTNDGNAASRFFLNPKRAERLQDETSNYLKTLVFY